MMSTIVTHNGAQYGQTQVIAVPANFDFRAAAFSVNSYSDQNSDGSILAHGRVDNIVLIVPLPAVQDLRGYFTNGQWQVSFTSRTNWTYVLERTVIFQSWTSVSPGTLGNGVRIVLTDMNTAPGSGFYRVRAERQ